MNYVARSSASKRVMLSALTFSLFAFAVHSYAGSATANLPVTANISANCLISTHTVAFGAYDPISANQTAELDGTGSVSVTCTSGSSDTINLGQGNNPLATSTDAVPLRQMKQSAGTSALGYFLYADSGRTTVWGNDSTSGVSDTGDGTAHSYVVYGAVTAGQNQPAGSYVDLVVATVTF